MDGSYAGGTDFEEQDGSEIFSLKLGDGAFVGPEIGEFFGKGDGGDGKQGTRNRSGFRWDSCGGKMEAMVIDWAQPRKHQRARGVFGSKGGIAEKGGEVESLAFYEE